SAFVVLLSLPLTPSGKVDRRALPSPELASAPASPAVRAPRTPFEEIVVGAFREALRSPAVGVDDAFFAAGGPSLLAAQVVARSEAWWGIALALRAVFEAPTAAGLAERVEASLGAEQGARPALVARPSGAAAPLSFAQQRLWFLDRL